MAILQIGAGGVGWVVVRNHAQVIAAPKDAEELEAMLEFAINSSRPMALRYPKGEAYLQKDLPGQNYKFTKIQYAKGEILREGGNVAIIAAGSMVYPSLEAAHILASIGYKGKIPETHIENGKSYVTRLSSPEPD